MDVTPANNCPSSFKVFSSDRAAQVGAVQVACAFGQLVELTTHWLSDVTPSSCTARLEEELRQEVKKLGGHLQFFLQVSRFAVVI